MKKCLVSLLAFLIGQALFAFDMPSSFALAPGKSMRVRVTFSRKGSQGTVKNAIFVRVRGGEIVDSMLTVRGTITSKEPVASSEGCLRCRELEKEFQKAVAVSSSQRQMGVRYYFSGDCASCTKFIESEIPRLQRALGRRIVMDLVAFPNIVVDDTVLQGEKEIRERFEAVMREKAGTPGK